MSAEHSSYGNGNNNGGNGTPITAYAARTRGSDKFTIEQIAWALRRNQGLVMATAKTLQCSERTIHRYLDTYPELQKVRADSRRQITNLAEIKIVEKIRQGDNFALGMWLKTQAGWSEKNTVEHTGLEGGPIKVEADVTIREEKAVMVGMIRGHLENGYTLAEALKNVVLLGIPKEALKLLTRADLELRSNGNGSYEVAPGNLPEESYHGNGGGNGNGASD